MLIHPEGFTSAKIIKAENLKIKIITDKYFEKIYMKK